MPFFLLFSLTVHCTFAFLPVCLGRIRGSRALRKRGERERPQGTVVAISAARLRPWPRLKYFGALQLTVRLAPLTAHWTTQKGFDSAICIGTYLAELVCSQKMIDNTSCTAAASFLC